MKQRVTIFTQILDGNIGEYENLQDAVDSCAAALEHDLEKNAREYLGEDIDIDIQIDIQRHCSGASRPTAIDFDGEEPPQGYKELQKDLSILEQESWETWASNYLES